MKCNFSLKQAVSVGVLSMGLLFLPQTSEAAYTQENLNNEMTMAVSWMQNAAEYRGLCYQAYNTALAQVKRAAAAHKAGQKPLAIVLDADETVLDNSAYQAGRIGTNNDYTTKEWTKWVNAAEALAMPGATDYLQAVDQLGVSIFYVTNRRMDTQYDGTVKNMKELGFPQVDKAHLLLKTDSGNKQARFDAVAAKYDVVVYMGDNAGDLPIGTYGKKQAVRNAIVDANKAKFGVQYILLPNPVYGDWEPGLYNELDGNYWALTPKQKSEVRNKTMRKWLSKEAREEKAKGHKTMIQQIDDENAAIEKKYGLPAGAIRDDIRS